MAIVTEAIREIQFDDGSVMKMNAGESVEDVVTRLEQAGYVVNVF